ncbi:MAG: PD-(D/E)XK nuclease family protein [Gemmatimonadaceae bacterium]
MARLIRMTGPDPDTLLRAAAAPFCAAGPCVEPLPLLAVRQGGLRDAVHQLAADAQAVGWFGSPIVVFAELPGLFVGDIAPLDEFEREALLRRAIVDVSPAVLGNVATRTTVTDSLDRLFGDLIASGVAASDMERTLKAARDGEWEAARNTDVEALYRRYLELLAKLPAQGGSARTDGRDGPLRAARVIIDCPSVAGAGLRRPLRAAGERRSIDIHGLADLRRGWRSLLEALHAAPFVDELRIYLTESSNTTGAAQRDVAQWLQDHADETRIVPGGTDAPPAITHLRSTLFTLGGSVAPPAADVSVTAAPDLTRELEGVAREIKRLLASRSSAQTSAIAVVARKARPYLTCAADVFARYGIPVTARLRYTLTDVPAIAALLRCLRSVGEGWTVGGLRELAASPYFTTGLDAGVLGYASAQLRPRGLAEWIAALGSLEEEARSDVENRDGPALERLIATRDALRLVQSQTASLNGPATLADWIVLTRAAIGSTTVRASENETTAGLLGLATNVRPRLTDESRLPLLSASRIDAAAFRATGEVLSSWQSSLALAPAGAGTLSLGDWIALLETTLAQHEATVRTGMPGGVQLLEALSADGGSFDHVFVVGMSVGAFPAEPAPDPLFADHEKEALLATGLPIEPARVWFDREAALWEALARSARRTLSLSYAYADANGAPQLAAAYLDDAISRYDATIGAEEVGREPGAWVKLVPGSYVFPDAIGDVWSLHELGFHAAASLRAGNIDRDALLGYTARNARGRREIEQLLATAGVSDTRATMRAMSNTAGFDRTTLANPWNGRIDDPALLEALRVTYGDRVWSATQLETYGRCPFSFFVKYGLGVRQAPEAEDEDSALQVGAVMHSVLARVYGRLVAEFGDDALNHDNADRACEIVTEECVRELVPQDEPARRGIFLGRAREIAAKLSAYVVWEMKQNTKTPRVPWRMEYGFGVDGAGAPIVTLTRNGRAVRLRGRIDRVDRMLVSGAEKHLYVVDHKSGDSAFKGVTSLQPAGGVLQLALYLAALRELEPEASIWGGAYQIVRTRSRSATLDRCSLVQAGVRELGNPSQLKAQATIDGAAAVALSINDEILAGHFPARVPENVTCLHYCDCRHLCREERIKSW